MNTEVQGDGDPRHGSRANELGVAEKSGRTVVVAVKEGWRKVSNVQRRLNLISEGTYSEASS